MKLPLLDLKPTQFALGYREVDRKIAKLQALGRRERRDYVRDRPVPVVLSWSKLWHIVDHHHHTRACWEIGVEEIPVEMKADLSHLTEKSFWETMKKAKWVHLYDQFGRGPHAPNLLPQDIRGMADDPYRSLAWALRHSGGYEKSSRTFSDFEWADFLRKRIAIAQGTEGFKRALTEARRLAHQTRAKDMPGFLPRKT